MKTLRKRAIQKSVAKTVAKKQREFIAQMDNSDEFIRVSEEILGAELMPFQKAVLKNILRQGVRA